MFTIEELEFIKSLIAQVSVSVTHTDAQNLLNLSQSILRKVNESLTDGKRTSY